MYAIKPAGLLLYMPKFGIRTAVHLLDKAGLPKPVLNNAVESPDDNTVLERRKQLDLEAGRCSKETGILSFTVCLGISIHRWAQITDWYGTVVLAVPSKKCPSWSQKDALESISVQLFIGDYGD